MPRDTFYSVPAEAWDNIFGKKDEVMQDTNTTFVGIFPDSSIPISELKISIGTKGKDIEKSQSSIIEEKES